LQHPESLEFDPIARETSVAVYIDRPENLPTPDRPAYASAGFLPANPFRPPDWRWRGASQPPMKRSRRGCRDDDWVVRCRRFQAKLEKAGGDVHQARLARAHKDVLAAYLLRQGEPRRRWEVEARVLAGQTDEEIGDRVGVDGTVIQAYEAMFFAVRTRLRCCDWVMACVIGPKLWEGFDVGDVETVWKVVAYQCGPVVFDSLIENVREDGRPPADPELAEQLEILVAVTAMPAIPKNAAAILRLDALVREIDRADCARVVAPLTRPLVNSPIDVHFSPETVPLVRAGCAPNDSDGAELAVKGGPIELSGAG
jgi:hypothetical protein